MSSSLPPLENLAIFDNELFTAGDIPLTYNTAIKKFLRYPAAQGDETLQAITVNGTSTFNNNILVNSGVHQDFFYSAGSGYTARLRINEDMQAAFEIDGGEGAQDLSVLFKGLAALNGNISAIDALEIGHETTGQTNFQNYTNVGASPGFIFKTVTSTASAKPLAIIPYNQPSSLDSTQNLATTAFVQSRIATFLASANVYASGTTTPQSMSVLQIYAGVVTFPNVWTFTTNFQWSSSPQNSCRINMGGNQSLSFQGLNSLVANASAVNGVSFGNLTGNTQIQNYANTGVTPGFTFSSVTNVATAKVLGILAYNQPGVNNDSQILATTSWVQAHELAGTSVTNSVSNINYSLPLITSSATGKYPFYSGAGLTFNPSNQLLTTTSVGCSQVLTNTINNQSNSSILLMSSPTVVPLPTALSGVGFGWNESGGNGETTIRNYAQAGIGGITFATVNVTNASATIATISTTLPAANNSTSILATTQWVQTAIDAKSSIPVNLAYTYSAGVIFMDALNNEFVNFGNQVPLIGNIIGYNMVNFVVGGKYQLTWITGASGYILFKTPTGAPPQNTIIVTNLVAAIVMAANAYWVVDITLPVSFTPYPSFMFTNVTF